jgi:hypothetical protein
MTKNNDQDRAGSGSRRAKAERRTCPMCGKPTAERTQPFCSKRCQQLDLARWLDGSYRVPTDEPADPGDLPREDEE